MIKLLIIADDFTGALDTGVQFSSRGAFTKVITELNYDFSLNKENIDVLVIVAETRHLPPDKTYDIIFELVTRALPYVDYIYKKTDSALRGNIGSEFQALMDAAGISYFPFFPAFPKMNRITKNGIHYIENIPVAESVFAVDPFTPVLSSSVSQIIETQTNTPAVSYSIGALPNNSKSEIQIFDSETDEDLQQLGNSLGLENLKFCAGCAGFAPTLATMLGFNKNIQLLQPLSLPFFIICGSMNPITIKQVEVARSQGFPYAALTTAEKMGESWNRTADTNNIQKWITAANEKNQFILDTNDPMSSTATKDYIRAHGLTMESVRTTISKNLAIFVKEILDTGFSATFLCTGGDTLLALMREIGTFELVPLYEIVTGVVLTTFNYKGKEYHLITKSGGFGNPDLFVKLKNQIFKSNNF